MVESIIRHLPRIRSCDGCHVYNTTSHYSTNTGKVSFSRRFLSRRTDPTAQRFSNPTRSVSPHRDTDQTVGTRSRVRTRELRFFFLSKRFSEKKPFRAPKNRMRSPCCSEYSHRCAAYILNLHVAC